MGIFDKIGDVVGDIVDGVVDFVDDVLGIELVNILDNDFVKYGLMAASIFTGGVAIVNGVIQGAGAAAAAKGFASKFVAGASEFVKGVASGLANPMKTAKSIPGQAGKLLTGDIGGMAVNAADTAAATQSAAQKVLQDTPTSLVEEGAGQLTDPAAMLSDKANAAARGATAAGGAPDPGFSLSEMGQTSFDPNATDFQMGGAGPANASSPGFNPVGAESAGVNMSPTADSVSSGLKTDMGGGDFLSKMVSGAKDFATSPMGMQTMAGMVQGYANGQALEERWDRMDREERRRRASWEGFGDRPSRGYADMPSLQDLRARNQKMRGYADSVRNNGGGWAR